MEPSNLVSLGPPRSRKITDTNSDTSSFQLVDDDRVIAAGFRRYLKGEGLAFLRELEKVLIQIDAQLRELPPPTSPDIFQAAWRDNQKELRRMDEAIRTILSL